MKRIPDLGHVWMHPKFEILVWHIHSHGIEYIGIHGIMGSNEGGAKDIRWRCSWISWPSGFEFLGWWLSIHFPSPFDSFFINGDIIWWRFLDILLSSILNTSRNKSIRKPRNSNATSRPLVFWLQKAKSISLQHVLCEMRFEKQIAWIFFTDFSTTETKSRAWCWCWFGAAKEETVSHFCGPQISVQLQMQSGKSNYLF